MPSRLSRLFWFSFLLTSSTFTLPHVAVAQEAVAISGIYQQRANELLEILKGAEKEEEFFSSSFLEAVPPAQFRAGMLQLRAQYGEPQAIKQIVPASDYDGTLEFTFAKATVAMRMVIDKQAPYPVIGLLVTGANMRDDGILKIKSEFKALRGQAGFEIAEVSGEKPSVLEAANNSTNFAIGSGFKLYVLAELARSIKQGQRQWSDVVTLDRKSLPSGVLQNWPDGTPLTLQTLATMMISISDNTATDILMAQLGRERLADIVKATDHSSPDSTLPLLTTLEAFALKMPGSGDLRKRYLVSSEAEQTQLLKNEKAKLGIDSVSVTNLANQPRFIDQIEWFASPSDVSRLLQYIHRLDDPVVKDILAINPIIGPGDAKRWSYVGSKGGSEPGVVSFVFLVSSKTRKTYAVSGSWNNPDAPVDGPKFLVLMNRLLNIAAAR